METSPRGALSSRAVDRVGIPVTPVARERYGSMTFAGRINFEEG
ncbi:hypothetical protein EVAR_99137_1, partial [Eumeta japonica]